MLMNWCRTPYKSCICLNLDFPMILKACGNAQSYGMKIKWHKETGEDNYVWSILPKLEKDMEQMRHLGQIKTKNATLWCLGFYNLTHYMYTCYKTNLQGALGWGKENEGQASPTRREQWYTVWWTHFLCPPKQYVYHGFSWQQT
jgi:hypothetical protein